MKILSVILIVSFLSSCSVEYKISHYKRPNRKQTCIVGNRPF